MRELPLELENVVLGMTDDPEIATWYLNVETGETIPVTESERFELESYESPDEAEDLDPRLQAIALGNACWEEIPHIETRDAFQRMERFLGTIRDADERRRLDDALDGRGAFGRFRTVLSDYPGELQRWYDFKDAEARLEAIEWLASLGIQPVPPVSGATGPAPSLD